MAYMQSGWSIPRGVVALLGGLILVAGFELTAELAHALCVTPPEEGVWYNIDPSTEEITQAEIHLRSCGDLRICDEKGCTEPKTTYSIELWGKCHPSDCYWGKIPAESRQHEGALWIVGTYAFGWKTADVWLRTYDFDGQRYL